MQLSPQFMQERQPYVRFEERPIEGRDAAGLVTNKLVDFAIITPVGTKDVVEKVASEWFSQMTMLERMDRWDPRWTERFKEMYKIWKATNTTPLQGTPVVNWPVLSKAQVKILKDANILTVEDLAQANEEGIGRLGMGGRNLVTLAKSWLEASGSTAADLSQRNAALLLTNQELANQVEALAGRVSTLEAQLATRGAQEQGPISTYVPPDAMTLRAKQNDNAEADFDKIVG